MAANRTGLFADPVKPALLAALRAQLEPEERLAWAAAPEPAACAPSRAVVGKAGGWDALAILGGGYAALGACLMAVRSGSWRWLALPSALLLLGMLASAVARRQKARARRALLGTVYGVTTRRALIVRTYPAPAVQSLAIDAIAEVSMAEPRADCADLGLHAARGGQGLVFRGIFEPERARKQLLRVIRDPQAVDQEIAAAQAYAMHMQKLMATNARS